MGKKALQQGDNEIFIPNMKSKAMKNKKNGAYHQPNGWWQPLENQGFERGREKRAPILIIY